MRHTRGWVPVTLEHTRPGIYLFLSSGGGGIVAPPAARTGGREGPREECWEVVSKRRKECAVQPGGRGFGSSAEGKLRETNVFKVTARTGVGSFVLRIFL